MRNDYWLYEETVTDGANPWAICATFEHMRGTDKNDAFAYTIYSEDIPGFACCIDLQFKPFESAYTEVSRIAQAIETFKEVSEADEKQLLEWIADIRSSKE